MVPCNGPSQIAVLMRPEVCHLLLRRLSSTLRAAGLPAVPRGIGAIRGLRRRCQHRARGKRGKIRGKAANISAVSK